MQLMNIDTNAPVITRDKIEIAASPDAVWQLFTDVSRWPSWNKEITSVSLDRPLAAGVTFTWRSWEMVVAATVAELVPNERIAWMAETIGIIDFHVWKFALQNGHTLVQSEGSWSGGPISARPEFTQKALDASIRYWLESLKRALES